MSASKMTTEQLLYDCFAGVVSTIIPCQTWQSLARAARRFVKAEQAEKNKQYNDVPNICLVGGNKQKGK